MLALVEGNSWHWGSPQDRRTVRARRILGLVAFVQIELRVEAPMLDFSFFRSRTSAGANIVAFMVSFAMFAQFFFLTLYMQNVLHYSPLQTGIRFLPSTLVIIVMGPLAGRLTDRVGARPLMAAGLALVATALGIQSHADDPQRVRAAAARVHPDGPRHGPRDVPDEHRRDERRRPEQGRRGVRRAVDEPDGRRQRSGSRSWARSSRRSGARI